MNILKRVLSGLIILIAIYGLYSISKFYSPGSFSNAETYVFGTEERELIKIISEFKEKYPKYVPPEKFGLSEGRRNPEDHWYNLFFYYPETNEIVYAWTISLVSG